MVIVVFMPLSALAAPTVEVITDYYPVYGTNLLEMERSKRNQGPAWSKTGEKVGALAIPEISWRFELKPKDGKCYVTDASVDVKVRYIMPEWQDYDKAPVPVQVRWGEYYRALKEHEEGHGKIALATAHKIYGLFTTMRPRGDCKTLEKEAEAQGMRLWKASEEAQVRYDERTRHGETQGAKLLVRE